MLKQLIAELKHDFRACPIEWTLIAAGLSAITVNAVLM